MSQQYRGQNRILSSDVLTVVLKAIEAAEKQAQVPRKPRVIIESTNDPLMSEYSVLERFLHEGDGLQLLGPSEGLLPDTDDMSGVGDDIVLLFLV
jgi:hypothetical protein